MRVVVVGAAGQLGSDLLAVYGDDAIAVTHADLDVNDAGAVTRLLTGVKPDWVINTAAFVNVDACEGEAAGRAWEVNALGAGNVARAAAALGVRVLYYSTNYVFAGDRPQPYREDDAPAPRSIYAITKLAGEYATQAYCPDSLIVRTAGLYGRASNRSKGGNFVERILTRARSGAPLRVVDDQTLTPTSTRDLARATHRVVDADATGLMHLTNSGACSWYAFAVEAIRLAGLDVVVEPISSGAGQGGAARPRNGVLATARGDAPLLRPWQDALAAFLSASPRTTKPPEHPSAADGGG